MLLSKVLWTLAQGFDLKILPEGWRFSGKAKPWPCSQ